jgi:hypothetical protein
LEHERHQAGLQLQPEARTMSTTPELPAAAFPRDRAHYDLLNRVQFRGSEGPEIEALDFRGTAAKGNVYRAGLDQFSVWQHNASIRFSAVSDADLWRIWHAAEAQHAAKRAEQEEAQREQVAADAASKAAKAAKRAIRLADDAEGIGHKTRIFRCGGEEVYFLKIRIDGEIRFQKFERECRGTNTVRFKATNSLTCNPEEHLRRNGVHPLQEKYLAGFNTDLIPPYSRHEYAQPRNPQEAEAFARRVNLAA